MTDQQPTNNPTESEIPEPHEWHPDESVTSGTSENSITLPDFVPQSFKEALQHYAGETREYEGQLFPVVDKAELQHVPFMVVDWIWNQNQTGKFVSLRVIDAKDRRWCINDGGTGIPKTVLEWEANGWTGGVMCKNGLRKSDYTTTVKRVDKKTGVISDELTEATTWYIA